MDRISTFVPGICCAHDWQGPKHRNDCTECGATCTRDENGAIVTYSAADTTERR